MAEVTELLVRSRDGDQAAREALAPMVYGELKKLAASHVRRGASSNTIQATELVNDAFMRLVGHARLDWDSRNHFYALASKVMRQILVDRARARGRDKRGGNATHLSFDDAITVSADRDQDILAVEDALARLQEIDPRQAEIVTMRFYGGMSMQAVADALGVSKRTADREWALIKAWLRRELAS